MRILALTTTLLLAALSLATAATRIATATFTPRPSRGTSITVIDFARAHGTAQGPS